MENHQEPQGDEEQIEQCLLWLIACDLFETELANKNRPEIVESW
ncbi:MAG TPA: hypothetical protein VMB21_17780 [Candidatus Limnocylindria bacterium]|jgi:hypothetical protein|nr:hypothetical protein [Candidatus Limnocylindria bacterium]